MNEEKLKNVIYSILDGAIQEDKIKDVGLNEIITSFRPSSANIPESITVHVLNHKTNSTEVLCKIKFDSFGNIVFIYFKNNKPHEVEIKSFDDIKDKYADKIVARIKEILD